VSATALAPPISNWLAPRQSLSYSEPLDSAFALDDILGDITYAHASPTDFVRFAVQVRVVKKDQPPRLEKFSFDERRYLRQIYNTPSRRVMMMCGRQVEKSTSLGNIVLAYSCILPGFNSLFVSPSRDQTRTFSRDRLREPMETSPVLRAWSDLALSDSIERKQFVNRSVVTLRYAYHNADRTRGIPADLILLDEIQDIYIDHIPVILECASHSPYKIYRFSGTPKSMDNTIEYYWAEESTQNEWVVPCERHGTPKNPGSWHWNVLGERNIQKHGLSCERCCQPIFPMHPMSQWASMNPSVADKMSEPFEGFRIPQLMVPWIRWNEILDKYGSYGKAQFYNEVLGKSYDSGTRPLTKMDLTDNCDPKVSMQDGPFLRQLKQVIDSRLTPVYAGIDWGTGEQSYTVLTLGAYLDNRFTIFYMHRFIGVETEPDVQLRLIKELIRSWKVRLIGVDYGGGFHQNDDLTRAFGPERVHKYQYLAPLKKVSYEDHLRRWIVNRQEVMADIFNAIKRRTVFRFPRYEEWEDPYAKDMMNIFSEYNEKRRMDEFKKSPGATDDTFHSIVYCFLASMLERPRPDVIFPTKEAA